MKKITFSEYSSLIKETLVKVKGFGKKTEYIHGPNLVSFSTKGREFFLYNTLKISSNTVIDSVEAKCQNEYDHEFRFSATFNKRTKKFIFDVHNMYTPTKMRIMSEEEDLVVISCGYRSTVPLEEIKEGIQDMLNLTRNKNFTCRDLDKIVTDVRTTLLGLNNGN